MISPCWISGLFSEIGLNNDILKAITDLGDKIDEDTKSKVEESKEKLEAAMREDDLESLKKALEEFQQASQAIGQMAYQQAAEEQAQNESSENEQKVDDDNVPDKVVTVSRFPN